jgi:prepilin peptidase CpaA
MFAAVVAVTVTAAVIDLRTQRIPNALSLSAALAGLTLAGSGATGITLAASAAGVAIGLLLLLPGHVIGGTGAGDVKLVAALGSIVGADRIVFVVLFSMIAGGLVALVIAARRGRLGATLGRTARLARAPGDMRAEVLTATGNRFPFGPAIALGSVAAMFVGR